MGVTITLDQGIEITYFNTAEGASKLTLADWTSEFGGPRIMFEEEREIGSLTVFLTIEAVLVGDELENWEIKAA